MKHLESGTLLKGVGPNILKKRLIVKLNSEKTGYIYTDPLNISAPNTQYDSSENGIDPWFESNWQNITNTEQFPPDNFKEFKKAEQQPEGMVQKATPEPRFRVRTEESEE